MNNDNMVLNSSEKTFSLRHEEGYFRLINYTKPSSYLSNLKISPYGSCLLYTSDAADDMQCVDLGGRRIIKVCEI